MDNQHEQLNIVEVIVKLIDQLLEDGEIIESRRDLIFSSIGHAEMKLIRQNPRQLKSKAVFNKIMESNWITCPFGHGDRYCDNRKNNGNNLEFSDRESKKGSSGSDIKFREMKRGTLVIVPDLIKKSFHVKIVIDKEEKEKVLKDIIQIENIVENKVEDLKHKDDVDFSDNTRRRVPFPVWKRDVINLGEVRVDTKSGYGQQSFCCVNKNKQQFFLRYIVNHFNLQI